MNQPRKLPMIEGEKVGQRKEQRTEQLAKRNRRSREEEDEAVECREHPSRS